MCPRSREGVSTPGSGAPCVVCLLLLMLLLLAAAACVLSRLLRPKFWVGWVGAAMAA